jgi:hypothetical protein
MKSSARTLCIFVALGALFLASACKDNLDVVEVRKILVDISPQVFKQGAGLSRERVRNLVKARIAKTPGLAMAEPTEVKAAVLRVRIESLGALPQGHPGGEVKGRPLWVVAVEIKGRRDDDTAINYTGHATADPQAATGPGALEALTQVLEEALDRGLGQVVAAHNAENQDADILLAWLEPNTDKKKVTKVQRMRAIQILGARRDARAIPALSQIATGTDPQLAQAALGALTRIADPAAIDAVIAFSERKPPLLRRQAILAARAMGGKKAAAWLFTLSTGHDDPSVRAAASESLTVVEEGLAAGGKSAPVAAREGEQEFEARP